MNSRVNVKKQLKGNVMGEVMMIRELIIKEGYVKGFKVRLRVMKG